MEAQFAYLAAGFLLPLFPFSMLFNMLFNRISNVMLRSLLLLAWPQLGLGLIHSIDATLPSWVMGWAVFTALLYGLRALALRELGMWIAFMASSAWALLWIPVHEAVNLTQIQLYALGFSMPLILLALLSEELTRRFGAAYTGLQGGLAQTLPRFSAVLVMVVLAIIASPLFPAFFTLFAMLLKSVVATPVIAVALTVVWLVWSWSGARLLQGFIVGPAAQINAADLSMTMTWAYVVMLGALMASGIYLSGEWL